MTTLARQITGGVDTHLDVHVAAALDERGALLGVESFETTPAGYDKLLTWLRSFGTVELLGVEGTGSYGAGLTRHLHGDGVRVVEVDRPNRQRRRRRGKSDPEDAISAARAAQGGDATGEAKSRDGNVEAMRVLRVARASARKGRTQALNQMRSLISTSPDCVRADLRHLNVYRMLERAASYRPGTKRDLASINKLTLRMLARRAIDLEAEVTEIDAILSRWSKRPLRLLLLYPASAPMSPPHSWSPRETILSACGTRRASPTFAGRVLSMPAAGNTSVTASIEVGIARPIRLSGMSSSPAWSRTLAPVNTLPDG